MAKSSKQQIVDALNSRLREYDQTLRILEYSKSNGILFSNGNVLTGREADLFRRRLSGRSSEWAKNADDLITKKISESTIKSRISSLAGKECQRKHGDKIRQNLNTGTSWCKGISLKDYVTKSGKVFSHATRGETKESNQICQAMSVARLGSRNPMYGRKHSDEYRKKQSILMRDMIESGKFTPNSNNRNTHWNSCYLDKKFRSSWEALYQALNPAADYETLRIRYNLDGVEKVYIVDFIDHKNKIVVEVKPEELCRGEVFFSKMKALSQWADNNGYQIVLANRRWFQNQRQIFNYSDFDKNTANKIRKLYETSKPN